MSIHLIRDLETLHRDILSMCANVEEIIHLAVAGLFRYQRDLSSQLVERDKQIDRWDVKIEEDCLKILALHQPVAIDLRRITTVMKISAELERVADLGVNIAERAEGMASSSHLRVSPKMQEMATAALEMLHESIDAYVELDSRLAQKVCVEDSHVDVLNREIIQEVMQQLRENPLDVEPLMHLFSASRHIERVADHATNIAEDVVYLVEGEIIRHKSSVETHAH